MDRILSIVTQIKVTGDQNHCSQECPFMIRGVCCDLF